MVQLENLLCFHYRPLFDNKSGSFSQTWPSPPPPPPHTMLLQGGHFERTDPTLYGGRGEGTVKLSKKAKCTITFDQDCSSTISHISTEDNHGCVFGEKKNRSIVELIWTDGSWTHTHSIPAKSLHKVHKVRFRWSLLFPAPLIADCQFEENFCGWKSFSPDGEGGWKWSSGNLNPKGKTHWWLVRVVGDYFSGADRQFRRSRLCPLVLVFCHDLLSSIYWRRTARLFFPRVTAQEGANFTSFFHCTTPSITEIGTFL